MVRIVASAFLAAAACGSVSGDGVCAEGTFPFQGQCVPFDPDDATVPTTTATPPGGSVFEPPELVILRTDEPATIYYTTDGSAPTTESMSAGSVALITGLEDGSELKYFAVDLAGNEEEIKTASYVVDAALPDPITELVATGGTDQVALSWTNPAEIAGVLIVRTIGDPAPFAPSQGRSYTAGEAVGPGQEIVFAGDASAFTDTTAVPGYNLYTVFAFDDVQNYSSRVGAFAEIITSPTFTTRVSVTLSPVPSVTVVEQPEGLSVSGTATFEFGASELKLTLSIENQLAKMLYNPKVVVRTAGQGVLANPATIPQTTTVLNIGGDPFVYYGPEAIGILATATRDLVFSGINGTVDPVELELEIVSHPMLVTGEANSLRIGDSFPSGFHARIGCELGNSGSCNFTETAFNKTGSRLFMSDGRSTNVVALDISSFARIAGPKLSPRGFIDSVVVSPDGQFVYAVLNTNTHRRLGDARTGVGASVFLIKLDAFTLEELARVTLVSNSVPVGQVGRARGHRLSMTPDGKFGALVVKHAEQAFHVDLDAMQLLRVINIATPGTNGELQGLARYAAISPDNSKIFVAYRRIPNRIDVLDVVNSQITPQVINAAPLNHGAGDFQFGPDGRLYLARKQGTAPGLWIFNPSTLQQKTLLPGSLVYGIDFSPDGTLLYASDQTNSNIRVFTVPGDVEVDNDGNAANGPTPIPSGSHRAHSTAISPR